MCESREGVNRGGALEFPRGVSFNGHLPYFVEKESPTGVLLQTLFDRRYISATDDMEINKSLVYNAHSYVWKGCNPFESFLRSYYKGCRNVHIPVKFTSMEDAAWSMAEFAVYHNKQSNSPTNYGLGKYEYQVSINLLRKEWGKHESHWEDIVTAFWKLV